MIAVTGKIADFHVRVRKSFPDQTLDLAGVHGHASSLLQAASVPIKAGNQPSCAARSLSKDIEATPSTINPAAEVTVPMRMTSTPLSWAWVMILAASLAGQVT